jgi:Protein of unknown function (DUF4038)/Putative collagen-binding domain of a collagenase
MARIRGVLFGLAAVSLSQLLWGLSSLRLSPTAVGEHPFAEDPRAVVGQATAKATSGTRTPQEFAFPLKISKDGRFLVDRDNRPFRIQGDSAQSLFVNLTYSEAEAYLSKRKAQGFNTINVNLLEHKFGTRAPANRNGDPPFVKTGDFSTPNEAYFAYADSLIDLAANKGLLVSLGVMYLGYKGGDEGWWTELNNAANTREVCFKFGQYVGTRYRNRRNIFWVIGGDYSPPAGSEGEARLHKFLEGVKAAGATQLWAGDWNAPCISTDQATFAQEMNLNAVYTSGPQARPGATYEEARRGYAFSPTRPAYLKETGYEDENWVPGDAASVRRYEYEAILGGATAGGFFGNRDVWEFATDQWWSGFPFGHRPWQQSLDTAGASDMIRLGHLLDSVRWYDLVPGDLEGGKVAIRGQAPTGSPDYIVTAMTRDRRTALAYVPPMSHSGAAVTVELKVFPGSLKVGWYDPSSGDYLPVETSDRTSQGTVRNFVIPGKNARGSTDWVFVLRTN